MKKWLIVTLTVASCACALGCNREPSSEGTVVGMVFWHLPKDAPPEASQEAEDAFRTISSKVPSIERFEWGRIEQSDQTLESNRIMSHVLLVTFKDAESAFAPAFDEALREAIGEERRLAARIVCQLHDATPRVRTRTHGKVRRVVVLTLKSNATREEMQKVEDAMAALPTQIPAIKRLEWGTGMGPAGRTKGKAIDPAVRGGGYCLLLTFNSTRERDECLSHPAYKEFQGLVERYGGRIEAGLDYVAQVE